MIITVFRSRLRSGLREEYVALVERMRELAMSMPGYVSHKSFWADDDERVTIVACDTQDNLRAWRMHPEHRAAQNQARENFYTEYHVPVCELLRESRFSLEPRIQGLG